MLREVGKDRQTHLPERWGSKTTESLVCVNPDSVIAWLVLQWLSLSVPSTDLFQVLSSVGNAGSLQLAHSQGGT